METFDDNVCRLSNERMSKTILNLWRHSSEGMIPLFSDDTVGCFLSRMGDLMAAICRKIECTIVIFIST